MFPWFYGGRLQQKDATSKIAGTQKLVVWVDVSSFPFGVMFSFQPLVFGGVLKQLGGGVIFFL